MTSSTLLLIPQLKAVESARAFMLRVASENAFPRMFSHEVHSLHATSSFLHRMKHRDQATFKKLLGRFAPSRAKAGLSHGGALGDDLIPASCLHARARQVCSLCLAESPWSRLDWEVKTVRACPLHRVMLARVCPNCQRSLEWNRSTLLHCFCGQALSSVAPSASTPWDITWAKHVMGATLVSRLGRQSPMLARRRAVPMRLSKLLLMSDVVGKVLLPEHLGDEASLKHLWPLTVRILEDHAYGAYLWDSIFLHAAGNPTRLAIDLLPGRRRDLVASSYKNLLADLALPHALRELPRKWRSMAITPRATRFFEVGCDGIGQDRMVSMRDDQPFDPVALSEVDEDHQEAVQ